MPKKSAELPWLSVEIVRAAIEAARRKGASPVAAWRGGFGPAYLDADGDFRSLGVSSAGEPWRARRNNFVARHMAQVESRRESLWDKHGDPTRRHLALAVWAYTPEEDELVAWLKRRKFL